MGCTIKATLSKGLEKRVTCSATVTLPMKKRAILKISTAFWSVLLLSVLAVWVFSTNFHLCFGSHYRQVHFESPGKDVYCEYISEPSGWLEPVVGTYPSPQGIMADSAPRNAKRGHFLDNWYAYASFPDSFALRHRYKQVPHYTVFYVTVPFWQISAFIAVLLAWSVISLHRAGRRPAGHCQSCGYDLRGTPERCPECGQEAKQPVAFE